jgi:hypothetical protein
MGGKKNYPRCSIDAYIVLKTDTGAKDADTSLMISQEYVLQRLGLLQT